MNLNLQWMADGPLCNALEINLPAGKTGMTPERRVTRKALRDAQIDLEDAAEAAGGHRGTVTR